jgi:hypothetical protein
MIELDIEHSQVPSVPPRHEAPSRLRPPQRSRVAGAKKYNYNTKYNTNTCNTKYTPPSGVFSFPAVSVAAPSAVSQAVWRPLSLYSIVSPMCRGLSGGLSLCRRLSRRSLCLWRSIFFEKKIYIIKYFMFYVTHCIHVWIRRVRGRRGCIMMPCAVCRVRVFVCQCVIA